MRRHPIHPPLRVPGLARKIPGMFRRPMHGEMEHGAAVHEAPAQISGIVAGLVDGREKFGAGGHAHGRAPGGPCRMTRAPRLRSGRGTKPGKAGRAGVARSPAVARQPAHGRQTPDFPYPENTILARQPLWEARPRVFGASSPLFARAGRLCAQKPFPARKPG